MDPQNVLRILERERPDRAGLISILEDIQKANGYLSLEALQIVSHKTGRSLVDLHGLATFHRSLRLKPRGAHLVTICMGTACHIRKSPEIVEEFQRQLKIRPSETSPDKLITLDTVNCLGACSLGPVVVIDRHYHRMVSLHRVKRIVDRLRGGQSDQNLDHEEDALQISASCPHCNRSVMDYNDRIDGYPTIRLTASLCNDNGSFWLNSLYGDFQTKSDLEIPEGIIVRFSCPWCQHQLRSTRICPRCDAQMVNLLVTPAGTIAICSRRGCREHLLDLSE